MPSIRPATEADADAVLDLHTASVRAFGTESYHDEQVEAWASKSGGSEPFLESVRDESAHGVVAEVDDELAGFGHVDLDTETVNAVYVHPDHAREGVGSALLSRLEDRAKEAGLESLSLEASLNAVEFYEQAGYERVATVEHETTGGVELACVEMTREL
ncbi:N-acetyltransferase family protein [Haladaptatus sp. NG-SE-30]